MGPLAGWTKVKTTGTSQGPLQEHTRSCLPTLRPTACPLMRDLVPLSIKMGTSTTIALGQIGPSPKTASLCPVHSFWLVIPVGDSSSWGSGLSPWPLAIGGQITTESWSLQTPDCQHKHTTVATQTSQTWKRNQSTQVSQCILPFPVCQPFKTYQAKDLGLSFLDPQNSKPPVVPKI